MTGSSMCIAETVWSVGVAQRGAAAAAAAAAGGAGSVLASGRTDHDRAYDGVLFTSCGDSSCSLAARPPPNSPPERAMLRL